MALYSRDNKTRQKVGSTAFTAEPNLTYVVSGVTASYTISIDQSAFYSGDYFEVYISDNTVTTTGNTILVNFTGTGKTLRHTASTDFLFDEPHSYIRFIYSDGNWKDVVLDVGDIVLEDNRIISTSANTTIEDGFIYTVDTSNNPVTLTIPNTITHPCKFKVLDKKGAFSSTNYCKIDFTTNSFKLEGQAKDFVITESNVGYEFVSSEATYGFKPFKLLQENEGITDWLTATNYSVGKYCNHDGLLFKSIVSHTSTSNFYTDLANGNWEVASSHNFYDIQTITGNTTLSKWQQIIFCNLSANTVITLPKADLSNKYKEVIVKRIDTNYQYSLTVKPFLGESLNNAVDGQYVFTASDKSMSFLNMGDGTNQILYGMGTYDYSVKNINSNTTISSYGNLCFVDASSGEITLKLPAIESSVGEKTFIVKVDSSPNKVIVETSDTSFSIDGVINGNYILNNPYESALFCTSGKDTFVVASAKNNNYTLIDVNTTSVLTDFNAVYDISSSASGISVTLPILEHTNQSGKKLVLKKVSDDNNEITILVPVSHKIDGVVDTTLTLSNSNDCYIFVSDYENLDYKIISKPSPKSLSSAILNSVENKILSLNTIYEIGSSNVVGSVYTLPLINNKDNDQIIIKISCNGLNYENNSYFTISGKINGKSNETIIGNANYTTISFRWSATNNTWIYEG